MSVRKIAAVLGGAVLAGGLAAGGAAHATVRPAAAGPSASGPATQVTLPFTGLSGPLSVAVGNGYVYVADTKNNRVVELPVGATTSRQQRTLSFTGLNDPQQVAVGPDGGVYVVDSGNNRVLELPLGSSTPHTVPIDGLVFPTGLTVDTAGNVYTANFSNGYTLELPHNSTNTIIAPFGQLRQPNGMGTDPLKDVFATQWNDGNSSVQEVQPNSRVPVTLQFSGLAAVSGVTGDGVGDVFAADTGNNRILELPGGQPPQHTVGFTGLSGPSGVAVDAAGDLYVADTGNNRIVELEPDAAPKFVDHSPLLSAKGGAAYSYTFTATGVPAPTLKLGAHPAWLSISAAGKVSGTVPATVKTSFSYSVIATNSQGSVTAGPFTVDVAPGAVLTTTLSCPKTVAKTKSGTCAITVKNEGPDRATTTVADVELPLSLTKKSCSNNCAMHEQTVQWSLGTLGVGQSATRSVTFTATQAGLAPVLGVGSSSENDPSPARSVTVADITVS